MADTDNDRVEEFTTAGAYVTKFGSAGSGTGQFSEDKGVAISSSGGIYVTDENNNRVQEWSRSTWWPTSAKGSLSKSTTYLYQSVTGTEGTSHPAIRGTVTCAGSLLWHKNRRIDRRKRQGLPCADV